jgi:hypothetical protein
LKTRGFTVSQNRAQSEDSAGFNFESRVCGGEGLKLFRRESLRKACYYEHAVVNRKKTFDVRNVAYNIPPLEYSKKMRL